MDKKFTVEEYMRKETTTASPTNTLKDAIKIMLEKGTNGLIIINGGNQVVGIVSSWDIISKIVPDYLEEDKHLASFESADIFASRVHDVANTPISDFMTKHVHCVRPSDSIMEAVTLLSEHRIRSLPVVDENKVVIGVISRTQAKIAIGEALDLPTTKL